MATIKDLLSNMISKIHTKMDAPTVTEADNGKVLGVVEGAVGLVEQGGGLPSGGTPYQYLVTDGEGNTGWADRLAWEEKGSAVLMEQFGWNGTQTEIDPALVQWLNTATQCTVTFDGTEYQCEAKTTQITGAGEVRYVGDLSIMGVDVDNQDDVPFAIVLVAGQAMVGAKESGEHSISVFGEYAIVEKIPKRFIPSKADLIYDKSTKTFTCSDHPIASTDDLMVVLNEVYNGERRARCHFPGYGNDQYAEAVLVAFDAHNYRWFIDFAPVDGEIVQAYFNQPYNMIGTNVLSGRYLPNVTGYEGRYLRVNASGNPEWANTASAVPNAAGDTPTAAEFNALLAALRTAGLLRT